MKCWPPIILLAWMLSFQGCVSVPQSENKADIDRAVSSHVRLAYEYLREDQPNDARRHLSQARELRPKSEIVHNALAIFYAYLHNPEKEEEHLKRALRYNSHYSAARNNYGLLLSNQGRYAEAVKQFQAAAHDLDNPSSGLAYANLGRCYEALGDGTRALAAYRRAERLHSAGAGVYLSMAELYFSADDEENAQRYYGNYIALEQNPNAAALWLGIRLADQQGDMATKAHYEALLKNGFPNSEQYKKWSRWDQHSGE